MTEERMLDHLRNVMELPLATFAEIYAAIRELRQRDSEEIRRLHVEVKALRQRLASVDSGHACCGRH